ncbi:MAG: hypothetical protein ACI857_000211 [Arenicella sp.]|jgi:hypothetical protein
MSPFFKVDKPLLLSIKVLDDMVFVLIRGAKINRNKTKDQRQKTVHSNISSNKK